MHKIVLKDTWTCRRNLFNFSTFIQLQFRYCLVLTTVVTATTLWPSFRPSLCESLNQFFLSSYSESESLHVHTSHWKWHHKSLYFNWIFKHKMDFLPARPQFRSSLLPKPLRTFHEVRGRILSICNENGTVKKVRQ